MSSPHSDLIVGPDALARCRWVGDDAEYRRYHDEEWGMPVRDSQKLFEKLCLEGAQAGLSWDIILKKREDYRRAFHGFDVETVAKMTDEELDNILKTANVVKNRLKVYSVRANAIAALEIMKNRDFSDYLWSFVGGSPIDNARKSQSDIPALTDYSEKMSKDLKEHGFKFVGPTICYAFMQSMGMVNDHVANCFRYEEVKI